MYKFRKALIAFLIFSSSTLSIASIAQTNKTNCSFNGRSETCTVNPSPGLGGNVHNLAVTWLSDGKQSFYAFSTSNNVMITEDNGRPTRGSWYRDGRNLIINSSRGNKTVIPWQ